MKIKQINRIYGSLTPHRNDASLVLHSTSGKMYMFGGSDGLGFGTSSLYSISTSEKPAAGAAWKAVEQAGHIPVSRSSHCCLVWGEQMWLYDGQGADDSKPPTAGSRVGDQGLADLHRFEFLSQNWTPVEQSGCLPDRSLEASTPFRGFHKAVTYGPYLLAFGCEQGDENQPPLSHPSPASPAVTGSLRQQLLLHAFDFVSSSWSWVPTSGSPAFTHCCALVIDGHRLIAVGYTPQKPAAPQKLNSKASTAAAELPMAVPLVKVSILDLSQHGRHQLVWAEVENPMATMEASSMMGSIASTVCDDLLVLYVHSSAPSQPAGQYKCAVQGRGALPKPSTAAAAAAAAAANKRNPEQIFTLDLSTWAWSKVAMPRSDPGASSLAPAGAFGSQAVSVPCMCYEPKSQALYIVGGSPVETKVLQLQLIPSPLKMDAPKKAGPHGSLLPLMQHCRVDPSADLRPFCCSELMSDVVINVSGTPFFAHRVVLAAASSRLRSALQAAAPQAAEQGKRHQVNVCDVQPSIMEVMLQYMYGCLKCVPPDNTMQLFSASDRYGLARLREACCAVLMKDMSIETVTGCALLADSHKHDALMTASISFAGKSYTRLQQVLSSPGYLQLSMADARLGQQFMQAAMQRVIDSMASGSPVTPSM